MAKENRPAWFKMFRNQKALIDSVPDEAAGEALKAIFQYFENGEIIEMTPLEFAVFSSVKPYIDERNNGYVVLLTAINSCNDGTNHHYKSI